MKRLLERLLDGAHLTESEAADLLRALAGGSLPHPMAGAFLAALRLKGETPSEIRGFARAMRELAVVPSVSGEGAVDVVGTGGDGSGSLNLSTGAALLAAACGQPVLKHGNGSVSSSSGSADVLAALGLPVPLEEEGTVRCYQETGFAFLFAPRYHPAMRALAPVRRSLGVRTVFNLLGPLTNPASPPFAVIGAFSEPAARLLAEAVSGLPVRRAFVIHGAPGWDEATPCGPFRLFDVRPGRVEARERDPAHLGLRRCSPAELRGGDAAHNARRLRAAFAGERGPHSDALALGAALALEVSGRARDAAEGLEQAREAIASGAGARLLEALARQGPAAREAAHG